MKANPNYSPAHLIKSFLALHPRQTIGQLSKELRLDYDETKDEVTAMYQRGEIEQFKTKLDKLVWQVAVQTYADGTAYDEEDHIPSFLKAMDEQQAEKESDGDDGDEEGERKSGGLTLDMKPVEAPVIPEGTAFGSQLQVWRDSKAAAKAPVVAVAEGLAPVSMLAFEDWKKAIEDGKAAYKTKKGGSK